MTEILLEYLKSLVTIHPDFAHTEAVPAYFEFDYVGMMNERRRSDVVLFVDSINGSYEDNKGDYQSDLQLVQFKIIEKLEAKDFTKTIQSFLKCKKRGEELFEKMRADREDPDNIIGDEIFQDKICLLFTQLRLENIQYDQEELSEDGWSGAIFRLPLKSPLNTQYDPELWGQA